MSVEQAESFSVPKVGMRIFITPDERKDLHIPIVRPEQCETTEAYFTALSLKIVHIGPGDLVKVDIGSDSLSEQEVWVHISPLLESKLWKIDRRRSNILKGKRRKEIRNNREVILRRGDVRTRLLRAYSQATIK